MATPSNIYSGQKTIDTTSGDSNPEPIASSQTITNVSVRALSGNSSTIYVGPSGVTNTDGYPLEGGEAIDIEIDDLNKVYLYVSVDTEGIAYLATG